MRTRLLWVALSLVTLYIVKFVWLVVVAIQYASLIFSGNVISSLKDFSLYLNRLCYQMMQYITFNDDKKPFPLDQF